MNIDDIDFDENLTFQQLINKYDADSSLLNALDNNNNNLFDKILNDTNINLFPVPTDNRDSHPLYLKDDICLNDTTLQNTKSLRQYWD